MIRLHDVSRTFDRGKILAVGDLSLHVAPRELVVLLGESGCGKTTTLKMINRLIEPTSGTVEVDGRDVREVPAVDLRRRIGYVFQDVGLFPHMTVAGNIAIVPSLLKWDGREIDARVDELLALVNLPPERFRGRTPRELSGGQRQRVGLARALAARPKLMLMDEPLGALDPITRDELQQEYLRIHRSLELTTLMVTHDMTEALLLADRIAVMKAGRLLQVGTPPELMRAPHDEYVRRLLETPKRQADRLAEIAGT